MTGRPWFKFYPDNWTSSAKLRCCSGAARGLWIELLCIMHRATPIGHLLVNGKAPSNKQLHAIVSLPIREIEQSLAELKENGVIEENEDGVLFSRKMVEDAKRAEEDKANGRKGGNPAVKRGVNPPVKGPDKARSQKLEARVQIQDSEGPDADASSPAEADETRRAPVDPGGWQFPEPLPSGHKFTTSETLGAQEAYVEMAKTMGWKGLKIPIAPYRMRALRLRMIEAGGLEGWNLALQRAAASSFCCGKVANTNFLMDFGHLLELKTFTNLIEGRYDDRKKPRDDKPERVGKRLADAIRALDDDGEDRRTDGQGGSHRGDRPAEVPPGRGPNGSGAFQRYDPADEDGAGVEYPVFE